MVEMSFKYHAAPLREPQFATAVAHSRGRKSGHGLVSHERGWPSNYEKISKEIFMMFYWLVVSNMCYFPFHICDVIPTTSTKSIIFQDGEIAPPTRDSL